MSDEVDLTTERMEIEMPALLEASKKFVAGELKPIGACHFCGAQLAGDELYCDEDCAHDHQRERNAEEHKRRIGHWGA